MKKIVLALVSLFLLSSYSFAGGELRFGYSLGYKKVYKPGCSPADVSKQRKEKRDNRRQKRKSTKQRKKRYCVTVINPWSLKGLMFINNAKKKKGW